MSAPKNLRSPTATATISPAVCMILWLVGASAWAAGNDGTPPPEAAGSPSTLIVSLEHSESSAGGEGSRLAVEWLRPLTSEAHLVAGFSTSTFAGSDWQVGRLGAFQQGDRTTLWADLYAGAGQRDGRAFDYGLVLAGLSWQLIPRRLYLDFEDRYLDIDTVRGNLAQTALTYVSGSRFSSRLAYLRSTSGNVDSEFLSARADIFASRRIHWLVGVAHGRTQPEVLERLGGAASDLRQAFAGIGFPLQGIEPTLILDYLHLDDSDRWTLSLTVRVPRTP